MRENKVWVIDDDQAMRWVLERAFQKAESDAQRESNTPI